MNERRKRFLTSLAIILGPILAIMTALQLGWIDLTTLGRWDIAISVGALVSVMMFLMLQRTK